MGSVKTCGVGIGRAAAMILLCAAMWLGVASVAANAAGEALNGDKTRTRFVIALDRETSFQVSSLSQPNRVVVDLPDVKIGLPNQPSGEATGLVRAFRGGLAAPGKVKIVIDVTDAVIVEKAVLEPPKGTQGPRLVLDIVAADASKAAKPKILANASVRAGVGLRLVQPPLPKPAQKPATRAAKSFKPVIVLDPGHGGQDSGATRNGAVEKEVVLAFSLVLRERLLATGRYSVLMTRDNDTFIPLDERRDFAERNSAALFMAIHADYAGAQASGATIYSLKDSVAQALKRSAVGEAKQNVLSEVDMKAIQKTEGADSNIVRGFLGDLAQREVEANKERTSVFARSMIEGLGESTAMMNNPDRSAAYRVLQTAKVPAVLLELAYVSNKQDAANLKSQAWRQKVADSIVTSIDNYFTHQVARLPM